MRFTLQTERLNAAECLRAERLGESKWNSFDKPPVILIFHSRKQNDSSLTT